MANSNTLYAFYQQRAHSLTERVEAACEHLTDERIRRVRVSIKRLRSLFRLMQLIRPRQFRSRRHERLVRKLFRKAGTVRDYQISQAALPKMAIPADLKKEYRCFLDKREQKAQKRLKKALRHFRKKELKPAAKLIRHIGRRVAPTKVEQRLRTYIDHQAAAIDTLLRATPSTEHMHQMRKHLKSLLEVGTLLTQFSHDDALAHVLTRAKKLQTQLGQWHDNIVLLDHLEAFIAADDHLPGHTTNRLTARQQQTARQEQHMARLSDSIGEWLHDLAPWRG